MKIHFQLQQVLRIASVHKAQILRQHFVKDKAPQCRFYNTGYLLAVLTLLGDTHLDTGLQGNRLILICQYCLIYILKVLALALGALSLLCQVVDTKHHVLCRHRHGTAVGGL